MPRPETKLLCQRAVVWSKVGDTDTGEPVVAAPVEVACRWEDGRSESVDAKGVPIAFDAKALVAFDVADDSIVFNGALAAYVPNVSELHQVRSVERVPDVKARSVLRELGLQRFGTKLPGSV